MFTLGANSVVLFYMVSGYIFYSITIHICLETVEVSSLSIIMFQEQKAYV